jgi:sodium/bile acid cotransporter 7
MVLFLARRWFFLILVGGVGGALAWPELFSPWTDQIDARWVVATAMFLMAWTLPARSLAGEVARPWAAFLALAVSYGLLPTLAWLAGFLVPFDDFRVGLLVMASVPCTLASAVLWTRMAGGNDATALFVVLLSTAGSWLVTTSWLSLAGGTGISPAAAPAMMGDLVVNLLLPVALGQLCRAWPLMVGVAGRHRPALTVVSQLLILVVILKAAAQVGERLRTETAGLGHGSLLAIAVACLGLHVAGLAAGFATSAGLGLDRPRCIAVAFAGSQKTLPVALLLAERFFRHDFPLAVVPLMLYHVGQLLVDTGVAGFLARHSPRQFLDPV